MEKKGKEGIICTYCDAPALPDTDPPVCVACEQMHKHASEDTKEAPKERSLKELM